MISMALSRSSIGSVVPGTTGTFAPCIDLREVILSPIVLMAYDDGPINMIPSFLHRSENSAFSDKKP